MGRRLTARAITDSGDNSRDLTRKTEGQAIRKVMGGVGKNQAREGDWGGGELCKP